MPNMKDIKRRLKSVANTQKITKAMKMVAAAKLRRAREKLEAMRPYVLQLERMVASALASAPEAEHALLEVRPNVHNVALVLLSSDRGLCGGFNTNTMRKAETFIKERSESAQVKLIVCGRKGDQFFSRRKQYEIMERVTGLFDDTTPATAAGLAARLAQDYANGKLDEIHVLFADFISPAKQDLRVVKILPVSPEDIAAPDTGNEEPGKTVNTLYTFEPDVQTLTAELLKGYLSMGLFRMVFENLASEQGARMTAMENATKNAGEMLDSLTLEFNKARQQAITADILDIVGGAEALRG